MSNIVLYKEMNTIFDCHLRANTSNEITYIF